MRTVVAPTGYMSMPMAKWTLTLTSEVMAMGWCHTGDQLALRMLGKGQTRGGPTTSFLGVSIMRVQT